MATSSQPAWCAECTRSAGRAARGSPARAERDIRRGHDPLTGNQRQPKALRDGGEDQDGLHERKAVADALARPATEREIREAWQRLREPLGPPLGTKALGLLERAAITMDHPRRHDEDVAAPDALAGDLRRGRRLAPESVRRRIEA